MMRSRADWILVTRKETNFNGGRRGLCHLVKLKCQLKTNTTVGRRLIWIPSLSLLRTQANMPGLFSTTEPLRLLVFLFLFFPSLPRTPSSASFRFCVNVATLEASHSAPSPFLGALGPFAMLSPAIIVSLRSVAYHPCPLTRLSAPRSAEAVAMVSLLHPVPNAALGEESARVMFAE